MPENEGKSPPSHTTSGNAGGSREDASRQPPVGHEKRDINVRGIVIFLVILAFGAVAIHVGLWIWLKDLVKGRSHGEAKGWKVPAQEQPSLMTGYPRLQISPRRDWQVYLAEQEQILNSGGWVDRSNGIVRIPISDAIEIVATKGLPAWRTTNHPVSPLELQQQRAVERGGGAR